MRKKLVLIGTTILLFIFALFYFITVFFLERMVEKKDTVVNNEIVDKMTINDKNSEKIILDLYKDVRILYDVVNSKFKVDQENIVINNEMVYKYIVNFDDVMSNLFTDNGVKKYISDLKQYFLYTDFGYYLAGSLVSYQTYYFRGDNTNIYILNKSDNEINAIIYEKWTSNNTNTLATIKVVKENNRWLVDNLEILSNQ